MTLASEQTVELMRRLLHRLAESDEDPGEIHSCIVCGGKLHVYFSQYMSRDRKMLGINAECDDCKIKLFIDTESSGRKWLKDPPSRSETRKWFRSILQK